MNGPNPVCTSARKKMNQSRPRKLSREGVGAVSAAAAAGTSGGAPSLPSDRCRRSSSTRSIELDDCAFRIFLRLLVVKIQRLQAARSTEHNERRVFLVFGRCRHLLLGQFERDA